MPVNANLFDPYLSGIFCSRIQHKAAFCKCEGNRQLCPEANAHHLPGIGMDPRGDINRHLPAFFLVHVHDIVLVNAFQISAQPNPKQGVDDGPELLLGDCMANRNAIIPQDFHLFPSLCGSFFPVWRHYKDNVIPFLPEHTPNSQPIPAVIPQAAHHQYGMACAFLALLLPKKPLNFIHYAQRRPLHQYQGRHSKMLDCISVTLFHLLTAN